MRVLLTWAGGLVLIGPAVAQTGGLMHDVPVPTGVPIVLHVEEGALRILASETPSLQIQSLSGQPVGVSEHIDDTGRLVVEVRGNGVTPLRVRVPTGHVFRGETGNGVIRASGLTAPADLRTGGGAVSVETTSYAAVHTGGGAVRAVVGTVDWRGTLRVDSGGGAIRVTVLQATPYAVVAATRRGQIRTPLGEAGPVGRRALRAGPAGAPVLRLETRSGNIVVEELDRAPDNPSP